MLITRCFHFKFNKIENFATRTYLSTTTTTTSKRATITTTHTRVNCNLPFRGTLLRRALAMTSNGSYKLNEIEGDLFAAPATHSLAHCVGADFAMGAGIAVRFKQKYGQVEQLLSQKIETGGVAIIKDNDRFVYYLVTKPHSWEKPSYDTLRASLTAMRNHMRLNNVQKLAIPRIGCGIDGLEWDKVNSELENVFGKEQLEIVVYNFVPK